VGVARSRPAPGYDLALVESEGSPGVEWSRYSARTRGQSTLTCTVVAEAQSNGGVCAYVDAEHAMGHDVRRSYRCERDDSFINLADRHG